jgi:hypothetical protein
MRRQIPAFWLVGGVMIVGVVFVSIAWRNLTYERTERNVSVQWSKIEALQKEIKHLEGRIKNETAMSKIQPWARDQRGWRKNDLAVQTLTISASDLTPGAVREAQNLGAGHE